ncbi:anti-sigma factor family protein [Microvirga terricola]|uniref:Anti-sigma factor n=1 Tax=Microvirga terricola TaxID=2719797 RepID=A0ABX0VCE3_9HYPH|nr:anti-sigma factor [Microvirga terricola]NIX77515.1 anti-sigma factor [Microvirga terricola]
MTLSCADMKVLLHGHLDEELDAANTLQLENHLRTCAACADEYQRLKKLQAALRQDGLRYRASDALHARIMGALDSATAAPVTPTIFRWWQHLWRDRRLGLPAAAFAAGLAVALIVPRQPPNLEQELVSEHIRSLQANHITDVTTSDQHTVKPWFTGRLNFSPPVVDLASEGFALTGGRLDYIAGRAVAALVYKRREHLVNLFIWPSEKSELGAERAQSTVNNGYNTLHWSGNGMTFWAISDLSSTELEEFMHRFQARLTPQ